MKISRSLYIIPGALVSLTFVSGLLLSSTITKADGNTSSTDAVSITVDSACTMMGGPNGDSTTDNTYTATIDPGTSTEISGSKLVTLCNDALGYSIYAIGYSGDSYDSATHTDLIGTSSTGNIITNTSGTDSYWAMKLEPVTGLTLPTITNDFNDYHVVPSTYTQIAKKETSTSSPSDIGATVQTKYKINISSSQLAGTYVGKVKYTMVHPNTEEPAQPQPAKPGKIVYHPNNSSVVGIMGDQSLLAKDWSSCADTDNETYCTDNDGHEIDINTLPELPDQYVENTALWASNFKRDGYGFAGWNTAFDYSGTYYGPNQTITVPADVETNGLSLYAVWIKSAGSLQNWNGCSSLASGATTALTDERDNNTYAVAKLADGKCWMIENLRLADKDSSNNDIELSSINTHNPSLPLTNDYASSTTSNHLSPTTDPTTTAWCQTHSSACDDQSMLATNNTTLFTSNTASGYSASSNVYSYGNYYNWYSATGGHGKYGSSYGYSFTAPGDICPAGWHLPTGKDATGDFGVLDIALGGTGADSNYSTTPTGSTMSGLWRSYPNNFVYSGYVYGSSVDGRNSFVYYWSSSAGSSSRAYVAYFGSDDATPGTVSSNKNYGRMVRCVSGV